MKLILKRLPKIRLKVSTALNIMILHKKDRLDPSIAKKFLPKVHEKVLPQDLVCGCTAGQSLTNDDKRKIFWQAVALLYIAQSKLKEAERLFHECGIDARGSFRWDTAKRKGSK
nr:MAG TPA: hypothetical protein [Caudoviricetes sp.]